MDPVNKNTAFIETIVTDQGNGASYCSNCHHDLTKFVLNPCLTMPENCPGCGKKLIWGGIYTNTGGSDF